MDNISRCIRENIDYHIITDYKYRDIIVQVQIDVRQGRLDMSLYSGIYCTLEIENWICTRRSILCSIIAPTILLYILPYDIIVRLAKINPFLFNDTAYSMGIDGSYIFLSCIDNNRRYVLIYHNHKISIDAYHTDEIIRVPTSLYDRVRCMIVSKHRCRSTPVTDTPILPLYGWRHIYPYDIDIIC